MCKPWQLLAIWLPYYYLMNKCQKYISSDIRIQRWSDLIDTAMFPYLIIPIVMEALGIKKRQFVKRRAREGKMNIKNTALFDKSFYSFSDKKLQVPHFWGLAEF
mgnify:CR=1 FL=1